MEKEYNRNTWLISVWRWGEGIHVCKKLLYNPLVPGDDVIKCPFLFRKDDFIYCLFSWLKPRHGCHAAPQCSSIRSRTPGPTHRFKPAQGRQSCLPLCTCLQGECWVHTAAHCRSVQRRSQGACQELGRRRVWGGHVCDISTWGVGMRWAFWNDWHFFLVWGLMEDGTQQGNGLSRADLRQEGKSVEGKEEKQVLSHL